MACAGMPEYCLQSSTNEALENIKDAITDYLSVVDELTQV